MMLEVIAAKKRDFIGTFYFSMLETNVKNSKKSTLYRAQVLPARIQRS